MTESALKQLGAGRQVDGGTMKPQQSEGAWIRASEPLSPARGSLGRAGAAADLRCAALTERSLVRD